ncbi:Gfo/Idh/MocA family protein [Paenibacillus sp. Soil522]|uniref:Gfo/Idh/MocA family protein n=1 Tax=Paenibacillus sp. Soil522 TaxID=1736388 RepID=UPI000AC7584F|nr:Gfo/Idh/MocA family oxidoreductase [Paenibacillus sp. Soil522]
MKVGVIGLSEGNGHPFSFSAIVNGYDSTKLAAAGWDPIYHYLAKRDASEFGFEGIKVTHAWTQNAVDTNSLCEACLIPNGLADWREMLGQVDAVIVARDDEESHLQLALPFLEYGIPVFVDKPLTTNLEQLRLFRPYLESGLLMSCSGMRYAQELDGLRVGLTDYGELKLIRCAVVRSWEKYGVHMLEAVIPLIGSTPHAVTALPAGHYSMAVSFDNGLLLQIDCFGDVSPIFKIDVYGSRKHAVFHVEDNFSMFRRMLWHFFRSVEERAPAVPAVTTLTIMRILAAGRRSVQEGRSVRLDELLL